MTQRTREQLEELLSLLEELQRLSAENLRLKRKEAEEKVRMLALTSKVYEVWAAIIKEELVKMGGTPKVRAKPKEITAEPAGAEEAEAAVAAVA